MLILVNLENKDNLVVFNVEIVEKIADNHIKNFSNQKMKHFKEKLLIYNKIINKYLYFRIIKY